MASKDAEDRTGQENFDSQTYLEIGYITMNTMKSLNHYNLL